MKEDAYSFFAYKNVDPQEIVTGGADFPSSAKLWADYDLRALTPLNPVAIISVSVRSANLRLGLYV